MAMNNRLKHRGPDDDGIYVNEHIALGHRRLAIIDLSSSGHQPMSSYDGRYHIVYNGELYNFRELRFELQRVVSKTSQQAYFFQTQTDTEVILAAYARWGKECVNHFNGMFAFAIWDNALQQLFIARDRLGIKPLYYVYTNGVFAFSSEIRSLMAAKLIPSGMDEQGLIDYLRYQTVHAPRTIIKGVKMLLPGHFIHINDGDVKIHRYWQLNDTALQANVKKTYKEVCNDVNKLLTAAVQKRLVADVPFGAFLSGGIDSSAIVALMSKVSSEKVRTFTVTFDESEFSEARFAAQVAGKFHTEHHEIKLKPDDFLMQLPESLAAMDHPSGDGPNTYIVSKATKKAGITMALSGLGGDELFGGYAVFDRFAQLHKKQLLRHTPRLVRALGGNILTLVKPGMASEKIAAYLKQDRLNFQAFYTVSRQVLLDKQIREIYHTTADMKNSVLDILTDHQLPVEDRDVTTVSSAEIATYMQNVLLRDTDQMSMAHALEVRVPFLDHLLVEYVLALPDRFKLLHPPKKLLIDAMGDHLPPEIVHRPKMGFVLPWKEWMKTELKAFCEEKLRSLGKRKGFREEGILNMWKSFLRNDARVSWSRIWILVVLENWLQINGIDE